MERLSLLITSLLALYFGTQGIVNWQRGRDELIAMVHIALVVFGTVGLLVVFGFIGAP